MSFNKNISAISEYEAVVSAVLDGYVQGLKEGNFDKVMTSFHPDATMYGYTGDVLSAGSIHNLTAYMDQFGPGKDMTSHIDVFGMTTTMAVVRLELENAACGLNYTDYHGMMKFDGKWKIVSKMFHAYDK
jgi:hypothetical protein